MKFFVAPAFGEIKVDVLVGLPGKHQVVGINNIGGAETHGGMDVAGRGNKKSKNYVFV